MNRPNSLERECNSKREKLAESGVANKLEVYYSQISVSGQASARHTQLPLAHAGVTATLFVLFFISLLSSLLLHFIVQETQSVASGQIHPSFIVSTKAIRVARLFSSLETLLDRAFIHQQLFVSASQYFVRIEAFSTTQFLCDEHNRQHIGITPQDQFSIIINSMLHDVLGGKPTVMFFDCP